MFKMTLHFRTLSQEELLKRNIEVSEDTNEQIKRLANVMERLYEQREEPKSKSQFKKYGEKGKGE